jgi:hypothetical protein
VILVPLESKLTGGRVISRSFFLLSISSCTLASKNAGLYVLLT